MGQCVIVESGLALTLQHLYRGTASPWTSSNVRLASDGPSTIDYSTVMADFTECTFDGYTPAPYFSSAGPFEQGDDIHVYFTLGAFAFSCTDTAGSGNVVAIYWTGGSPEVLLAAENIPFPFIVLANGEMFNYLPNFLASSEYAHSP